MLSNLTKKEFRSLLSDESVDEEGDDEDEGFVDDDDVDEDNNNSNAINCDNSISFGFSVAMVGVVFLSVILLLSGFHQSTEFLEKNEQQLQQEHNQANDGSSDSSVFPSHSPSSPLAGSPTTTTSAATTTNATITTAPTNRSKTVTITQTPTSAPSASTAMLSNTLSPSTANVTVSTSQPSVASKPNISPADSLKQESTSKDSGVLSLMSGLEGSDRYQRICSSVGLTTELCMTLRYPFPVPQEVPLNGSNLRHVDERFFQLTGLVIVDNAKLEPYRDLVATEEEVRACLNNTATDLANDELSGNKDTTPPFGDGEPSVAVAVFTRRKKGKTDFEFFGTRSQEQLNRVGQFFKPGHKFIIHGDSNVVVGSISSCTSQLFEKCQGAPKFPVELRLYCDSPAAQKDPQQRHRRAGFLPFEGNLDHNKVFLTKINFDGLKANYKQKVIDLLTAMKDPNAKSLETVSILVQYPVAHIAREKDLINFEKTVNDTKPYIAGLVDLQSPSTEAELAKIGWKLTNMFAFDGLTQHHPSETGAYADSKTCKKDQSSCDAVPDWKIKEHGPLSCRGPVPNGSPFRKFIEEERSAFQESGFDMRWYGQTWDFTNLFWWQHKSWGRVGLDCTHYNLNAGGVCMYKYFLQAMIDESLE